MSRVLTTIPSPTPQVDELVLDHLDLCEALARRYANRGIDLDDLIQVARVGLVCAAQRFRPEAGAFVPYAVATITGEIKRHFRSSWMVRPPRRLQEQRSDDAPHAQRETDALSAFRPVSLDSTTAGDEAHAAELPSPTTTSSFSRTCSRSTPLLTASTRWSARCCGCDSSTISPRQRSGGGWA